MAFIIMNSTNKFKNVIYLVTDSQSPRCITGMKTGTGGTQDVLQGENKGFAQSLTMSGEHYYSCHATEHSVIMYLGHFY